MQLSLPPLPVEVVHGSQVPVLVLGHARSGTSVFIRMLRKYLRIAFGTESQFIIRYHSRISKYGDLTKDANVRRLIGDLYRERWFERCQRRLGFETTIDAIMAAGTLEEARQVAASSAGGGADRLRAMVCASFPPRPRGPHLPGPRPLSPRCRRALRPYGT